MVGLGQPPWGQNSAAKATAAEGRRWRVEGQASGMGCSEPDNMRPGEALGTSSQGCVRPGFVQGEGLSHWSAPSQPMTVTMCRRAKSLLPLKDGGKDQGSQKHISYNITPTHYQQGFLLPPMDQGIVSAPQLAAFSTHPNARRKSRGPRSNPGQDGRSSPLPKAFLAMGLGQESIGLEHPLQCPQNTGLQLHC